MSDGNKVPFNIRLPEGLAARIRRDALRNNVTLDDVGALIFSDFFGSFTAEERSRMYSAAGLPAKRDGRKISTAVLRRRAIGVLPGCPKPALEPAGEEAGGVAA